MLSSESVLENKTHQILWDFEIQTDTNGSFNLGQMTRTTDSHKKRVTNRIVDFAVPVDKKIKLKDIKNRG